MLQVFQGFTSRVLTVLLAVLLAAPPLCAGAASKKGSFAFQYTSLLDDAELEWLKRFAIVVPGDILPSWQIEALHLAGSRIFFYEWATGIYLDNPPPLDPSSREAEWLLNANEPDAGPDGYWHAYYFDPYPGTLKEARAGYVDGRRRDAGYDGVFFDLVGSICVPAYLQETYTSRHPRTPYDTALSDFFELLKQKGSLIFTNQGYRTAQHYLPISDYDLSESLFTSFVWGERLRIIVEGEGLVDKEETFYRSWMDLRRIVGDIQSNVDRYNPSVEILHLNYTNPSYEPTGHTSWVNGESYPVYRKVTDRAAIYYGYVGAKLWGHESYSPSETIQFAQDEIYFIDLGHALGQSYDERAGVALRYYTNGVVVLNPSTVSQTVDLASPLVPPGISGLHDLYADEVSLGLTVTVDPTYSPASGRTYPSGRVYLYER